LAASRPCGGCAADQLVLAGSVLAQNGCAVLVRP